MLLLWEDPREHPMHPPPLLHLPLLPLWMRLRTKSLWTPKGHPSPHPKRMILPWLTARPQQDRTLTKKKLGMMSLEPRVKMFPRLPLWLTGAVGVLVFPPSPLRGHFPQLRLGGM